VDQEEQHQLSPAAAHPNMRQKQARVLALISDAFGGYGGISVYVTDFLRALAAHPRCGEIVALPRIVVSDPGPLPPNVTHVTAGVGGKLRYLGAFTRMLLGDRRFDVIICAHINLLPFAYAAHRLTGAPIVMLMYGIDVWQPPRNAVSRLTLRKLIAYVSISRITQQKFLGWAPELRAKAHILPNAIHLEHYAPGAKDPALAARYGVAGKRVLMTLGRLVAEERYKGFDEVIETLPDLLKDAPDLVYLIAGKGSDVERLKQKARALGVADHVVFTGYVAEEEKAALYRLADVYVMASSGEGFGFVILEALATGIPTIASTVDGGREALRDGMLGQLVDPAKPDELKTAIRHALKMDKKVPPGLAYFAYPNFRQRLHGMFDEWLSDRPA
jgi:phosphatidyl-myo-inositol dimannoside synthase